MNRERLDEIKDDFLEYVAIVCEGHSEVAGTYYEESCTGELITALEAALSEIERLNDKVLDLEQNS
jgi:hypothetical protein